MDGPEYVHLPSSHNVHFRVSFVLSFGYIRKGATSVPNPLRRDVQFVSSLACIIS